MRNWQHLRNIKVGAVQPAAAKSSPSSSQVHLGRCHRCYSIHKLYFQKPFFMSETFCWSFRKDECAGNLLRLPAPVFRRTTHRGRYFYGYDISICNSMGGSSMDMISPFVILWICCIQSNISIFLFSNAMKCNVLHHYLNI